MPKALHYFALVQLETESSFLFISGLWDSCQSNLLIFQYTAVQGQILGIFFVPFFLNSPRDRGYRLCRASQNISIGLAAPTIFTEGTRQCPPETHRSSTFPNLCCTRPVPRWACFVQPPGFGELPTTAAALRNLLTSWKCCIVSYGWAVCLVLIGWCLHAHVCAQCLGPASLWVLETYMPRVSYIRTGRKCFIWGLLSFCFLFTVLWECV